MIQASILQLNSLRHFKACQHLHFSGNIRQKAMLQLTELKGRHRLRFAELLLASLLTAKFLINNVQ